jgi:hypothetical protein
MLGRGAAEIVDPRLGELLGEVRIHVIGLRCR